MRNFDIVVEGNVQEFESKLIEKTEQEIRVWGKKGPWCGLADQYARQLTIISFGPYPEESFVNEHNDDELLPSLKHITKNTNREHFYRWGMKRKGTGNYRIIYTVHNYHQIVLLHYFDKRYNGLIRRNDLIPAEFVYEQYCISSPSRY